MKQPIHLAAALSLTACGLAFAQDTQTEIKIAPIPPAMQDVKTAPPAPPVKEPLPLAEAASAQDAPAPVKSSAVVGRGFLAGLAAGRVLWDEPGDGRLWAVGDAYKASFGPEGATYVPFFGSSAPRNFPVRFALRSIRAGASEVSFDAAATPTRSGDRIVFDRGIVDEVYDLSSGSIEQSFVFESLPERGELVIELAAESEMARGADALGLVLASEVGSVRYTSAVAIDAAGVREGAPTAWEGGGIAIRVGGERVASAAFPLVVDPVISTFDLDSNATEDHFAPDVSYDVSTNRWLAVYERAYSATDHDVYARLMNSIGGLVVGTFIDVSTINWVDPKVANNNIANEFLCVAEVGSQDLGNRIIRGRSMAGSTGSMGSQFTISGSETGEKVDPDVGGDPHTVGPTYYCVVWKRNYSDTDTDVHARLVAANDTPFGSTIFLSNSAGTLDAQPSISKGDGAPPASLQDWNVVFTRSAEIFDLDLYGARIHWDGTVTETPFAIETSSNNTTAPSVSTSIDATTRRYLVAYQVAPLLGDSDVWGKLMSSTTALDTANLTALTGAPDAERQVAPSVDCDGSQFVVAHAETYNGSTDDYDIYAATVSIVGTHLANAEGHQNLAFSVLSENQVEVACPETSAGPDRPAFVVWREQTGADNGDIEGGLYESDPFTSFCFPGQDGVIDCPCGNDPTGNRGCDNSANTGGGAIAASGSVLLDTVHLTASQMLPTSTTIFTQSSSVSNVGVSFGDGVRCATGTLLRLGTKTASGGVASYPGASDPSITERSAALGSPISPGDKRYYFAYYRDPNFLFACSATYNATNAVQVQW